MSIAQIIQSGVVVNAIAVAPDAVVSSDGLRITWDGGEYDAAPEGATLAMQDGAGIGWTLEKGVLVAPPQPPAPPPAVPASVSRSQFFHAAAVSGIITEAEALGIFKGTVPASLSAALATLSDADKFAAEIAIVGNATFERDNPLLIRLGAAMGKTPAQIDALFTLAGSAQQ